MSETKKQWETEKKEHCAGVLKRQIEWGNHRMHVQICPLCVSKSFDEYQNLTVLRKKEREEKPTGNPSEGWPTGGWLYN